jgi:hypothetical protein
MDIGKLILIAPIRPLWIEASSILRDIKANDRQRELLLVPDSVKWLSDIAVENTWSTSAAMRQKKDRPFVFPEHGVKGHNRYGDCVLAAFDPRIANTCRAVPW